MARDYAKKSKKPLKKQSSASRFKPSQTKNPVPGWIWLLAGLSIGVLIMIMLRSNVFSGAKSTTVEQKVEQKEIQPLSAKDHYQAVPADENSENEFSFHDVLENKVIEIPDEAPLPASKQKTPRSYIMQCGSFRQKSAAETLKAQIALTGFTAHINATLEKSGTRWFRVTLGPYKKKRIAEKQRHQLERNNLNNCRIW